MRDIHFLAKPLPALIFHRLSRHFRIRAVDNSVETVDN